ncbi:nitrate- and nitrite sensing domain-containing protein [Thermoactinospora rubra]|uniref:nitrate- and nitrite sensing domain-containing protein n=1 Tax=Thermoactinospora rubra TaxID=1088767 RepID=UPI000A10C82D|nr:nitrate- and nitrite sensing domain-containing protein [Thermoactinospora rubra]
MPPKRGRPIGLKLLVLLLVPLLSLAALWGFAAVLTGGDGLRLLEINTMVGKLADPSEKVNIRLQQERLATMEFMTGRRAAHDLAAQRTATDRAVATFLRSTGELEGVPDDLGIQLTVVKIELGRLKEVRGQVDRRTAAPLTVLGVYNRMVDAAFRMYDKMILVPDMALYRQARAVTALGEAKELLSRERALIVVVLAAGKMSLEEQTAVRETIATRRLVFGQALSHLDAGLRGPHERLAASPVYRRFLEIEETLRGQAAGAPLPPSSASWAADGERLWAAVERNQAQAVQGLVRRVTPTAVAILVKIGVAAGVGLLAVVASLLVSLRFRRRLVRELAELRDAATELAQRRLGGLVRRLREDPRAPAETTPLRIQARTAEVADIAAAFNSVQSTAVDAAVGQARLRHGISRVFVNLARRNQSLLHRQLLQLDVMEKQTSDPETLEELFKLDHLTTRMRRHAESLIILSGEAPGRSWRRSVPLVDVLRAAAAEVEEYARVEVALPPKLELKGAAVTDVVHLLAELIENATLFSPPTTRVDVRAMHTPDGLVVEIEDRGLGLQQSDLDELNARLATSPEFDLAQSDRLGLFVVARLAARRGVKVSLGPSPYGGLTATVLLPEELFAEQPALSS